MAPSRRLPPDDFGDRLAELDPERFVDFVTALYAARGWDVDRDERSLALHRGDDPDGRTVLPAAAGSEPPSVADEDLDAVVAARPTPAFERLAEDADAVVRGPEELYQRLLYGIDRETADGLARDYLGRALDVEARVAVPARERRSPERRDPASEERGPDPDTTSRDDASPVDTDVPAALFGDKRRRVIASVVLVALLAATAVGAGGLDGSPFADPAPATDAGAADALTGTERSPVAGTTPTSTPRGELPRATTTGRSEPDATASERRYVGLSPTCERPPELVTLVIVGALRNNDPETDDGIRTAWNFSARSSQGSTYETFEDTLTQEKFSPLFSYERIGIALAYPEPGGRAYRVTVTDRSGEEHAYHAALTKRERGEREGCWLLAGIVRQ